MQRDDLINGRFRLTCQAGHHWLAQDQRTHFDCLIIPLEDFTDLRVVRWLEQIWHPGLPRVLEQVRGPDDSSLVVLEHMPGQVLSDHLATRSHRRPDHLLVLIRQAAHLLTFLHEASDPPLMHLDLKPEHWIVLPSGDLGLIDFQTAVFYDTDDHSAMIPSDYGHRLLSLAYAAPELLAGHPCPASDLYALALICLQYLTGRPPEFCRNHTPHALLPDRLSQLADLLASCLADDLSERPPSTTDFMTALDHIIKKQTEPHAWRYHHSTRWQRFRHRLNNLQPDRVLSVIRTKMTRRSPRHQFSRICIWQEPELACELAAVWSQRANILLLDADLQDPRCDAYVRPASSQQTSTSDPEHPALLMAAASDGVFPDGPPASPVAWPVHARPSLHLLEAGRVLPDHAAAATAALLRLLHEAEHQYDCCLTVTSGLTHDAAACVMLLAADLIVMPIRADRVHWQSCQRQIRFLESKGILSSHQILYVLFPYQSRRELSVDSVRSLTGDQLAGVISDCPERDLHRGSHRPYWTRMVRRNHKEYLRLIDRIEDKLPRGGRDQDAAG